MSQLQATGYHIGGPTGVCAATGRKLVPGDPFVAALIETDSSEDLSRSDYSLEAWQGGTRPQPPLRLFGSWKGVVPDPNSKPKLVIDDEVVMDLFEQLAEQTEPKRVSFRFVLALMLIRKKLLLCEETKRGAPGTPSVLLVRRRGNPRPPEGPAYAEVIDPGLDEDSIEGIMDQFEAMLGGKPAEPTNAADKPEAKPTDGAASGSAGPAPKPSRRKKKGA